MRPLQSPAQATRLSRPLAAAETRLTLTAIILTYDEADNIAACLAALDDIEDVIVLDSGSTDDTVALARAARRDVRVFTRPFTDFGDQRNWAIDNCAPRHDWILFVDADEFCTPALIGEIADFISNPGPHVGAFIAGRNMFLGRWLKHSTMYPSYQLRLFRRGEVRFRKEGHGQREVTEGQLAYLRSWWRHEAFSKGVHQWIARHNAYSTNEVELILRLRRERMILADCVSPDPIIRRRALKRLGARAPLRPWARFFYIYVLRGGFLDGRAGLNYCLLRLAHDLHISVKTAERSGAGYSTGHGTRQGAGVALKRR